MKQQEIESCIRTAGEWVRQGKLREAGALCRTVIRQHPLHAQTLHLLGVIACRTGDKAKALDLLKRAVRISPRNPEFHNSLGIVLGTTGKPGDAVNEFMQALKFRPDYGDALANLGAALAQERKFPEAEAALHRAVELRPEHAEAHANLGNVLRNLGKLNEALTEYDRALSCNPNSREAHSGRAVIARDCGDPQMAVDSYRRALDLAPDDAVIHSNLIYAMHYQLDISSDALFAEHLKWAKIHAEPLYCHIKPFTNDPDLDRRLRVGYISADFREHPRARFIEPLLARCDRNHFEVFCYNDAARSDAFTVRFRQMAGIWRDTVNKSDEAVAGLIRHDRIDLLIDCTGHMAHNRMRMLAMKPAPIQILYPGYPNTSGLKTVDYWITDAFQDPPGLTERFHTEQLIRLEPFARCYTPTDNSAEPCPAPAARNGFITFGSMNNPVKNNSTVLELWARLMDAIPTSRLLVLVGLGAEDATRTTFTRHGIPASRITIVSRAPREKYLSIFNQIDITLDTFPYNGYTTTLDSLWMGVPVLTLEGRTNVSRAGVSLLSNVNLQDWIATSPVDYVDRAIRFSGDIHALGELRSSIRTRMQNSPLMDASGLIQKMEVVYRSMWRQWCRARRS